MRVHVRVSSVLDFSPDAGAVCGLQHLSVSFGREGGVTMVVKTSIKIEVAIWARWALRPNAGVLTF